MSEAPKREADDLTHSRPGSVDQQMEDTFPASDAPSFSHVIAGAPASESKPPMRGRRAAGSADRKVRAGGAKKPASY